VSTQRLDFIGSAGQRLSGRIELPQGRSRGWALFAHCFTCGKDSVAAVRVARALASVGIGTMRFDFTGLGESEGDFATSGFSANVEDLVAAAGAMADGGMPVSLLVGHSLGGAAVLAAAGKLATVRAVATIAAPFDVAHALHQFPPEGLASIEADGRTQVRLGGRAFTVDRSFVADLRAQPQGDRIASLHLPLMVMHSPRDQSVGIENATRIFSAARHPKSFVSLDDADHLLTRKADADYVATMIAGWASRYLAPIAEVSRPDEVVAEETGAGKFQLSIEAAGIRFLADEPSRSGGLGSGPTPYDLLSAALAACTTMTLRLYADSKGWPVGRIRAAVTHLRERHSDVPDLFTCRISVEGTLDVDRRNHLLEIAGQCPVHQTLKRGVRIAIRPNPAAEEPSVT